MEVSVICIGQAFCHLRLDHCGRSVCSIGSDFVCLGSTRLTKKSMSVTNRYRQIHLYRTLQIANLFQGRLIVLPKLCMN